MSKLDDAVVVGIGETDVGKLPGRTSTDLQAEAVIKALKDAGIDKSSVDGFINLDPYTTPESMFSLTVSEYLGIQPHYVETVDVGGTVTAMYMIQHAISALQQELCSVIVCTYGENSLTVRSSGLQGLQMENRMAATDWEEPVGVRGMVVPYGLLAQEYYHMYGDSTKALGEIAVTTRKHALFNPNAQMKKTMDMESYYESRTIATPLRLFDCSLVSDGAGALVLTTRKQANEFEISHPMVNVSGMASRFTHASLTRMPRIRDLGMKEAANEAMSRAGVTIEDIDVAEIHDAFTISVLLTLEALGFCEEGKGSNYILNQGIGFDSPCPINTHGGLLSQAHIGGMLHVIEAIRQLRGDCGERQVQSAQRALVSGNGGVFSVCGIMVLERCN
jgi:acetyl-CoA acetyltransferase